MANSNSVGSLSVTVTGNASPLEKELDRSQKSTKKFEKSFGTPSIGFKKLAGSVAIGNLLADGIEGLGSALINAGVGTLQLAADFEKAGVAFEVLTGNAEAGRQTLEDLQKLAIDTPFSSKGLIDYGRSLLGMGAKADQLVPILSRLGDVAQGDAETLGRLVLQFGQVLNSGSFKKQEFNVFAEAGADVQAFAKAAGVSMQEFNSRFEQGKNTAADMINGFNAMTSAGGRFYQMNSRMSGTFDGQLNTFMEKLDTFRIKIGTAFITGFKPGAFLENLAGSFGGLDQIETKLVPLFEKLRTLFDKVAAGAAALASVLIDRLAAGLGVMGDGKAFAKFEEVADKSIRAMLMGIGGLIDSIGELRGSFGDALRAMAKAAKSLVPDREKEQWQELMDAEEGKNAGIGVAGMRIRSGGLLIGMRQEAANMVWDTFGGKDTQEAARKAADAFGQFANVAADALGKPGRPIRDDLLKEYDRLKSQFGGKPVDTVAKPVAEIKLPESLVSKAAQSFYDAAIAKPPTQFDEFRRQAGWANEVARFNPERSDAVFSKLAAGMLDLEKDFLNGMKVELPGALRAGSQEAESIITNAIINRPENAQERVENVMRQARDIQQRQEELLKEIAEQLKKQNFETVGF